jgi:hypothetical protein
MAFDRQDVSPEGIRVDPAHSVRHPQQVPCSGDPDAVVSREAGGRSVVGDEDAVELAPDGYGDCLRLAEMLGPRITGGG